MGTYPTGEPSSGKVCTPADALAADARLVEGLRRVVQGDVWEGVPLASAVHWFVTILRRHGKLTPAQCRPGAALADLAQALAQPHSWLPAFKGRASCAPAQGRDRIWIPAGGHQDRSVRLWEPPARALGAGACLVVAVGRSQRNHLPSGLPYVILNEQPAAWLATRQWVLARLGRWLRELAGLCAEMGFAAAARWRLAAQLVAQVGKVGQVLRLQQRYSPRAAVVNWDRAPVGAALCAVLASRGIPTFTLVHGAFGAQNHVAFLPLAAQYVLTWGEVQAGLLRRAGVPAERLIPVGVCDPRPTRELFDPAERDRRLAQLGAAPGQPVVVVGLTCLPASERPLWAKVLTELHHRLPGPVILARLHPSNRREDFAGLLEESPRLRLVDDRMISARDTLALADAVVVDSSSFGFDALQRGIPVVVLEPPDGSGYLSVMLEATEAGAALYARDTGELVAHLRTLLTDAVVRGRLLERARAFEARYVHAYGQEALDRLKAVIEGVLSEARKPERRGGSG